MFGEIFDLQFDLKLEISDGENLVKIWGGLFCLPGTHEKKFGANFFGANFGAIFGLNFATFFGNFVQQKGSAKELA